MLYQGKPIYKADLPENPEETGMFCISLVDDPAVESNFLAFSNDKEKEILTFSVNDEEQRIVTGLVMAANRPILRVYGDFVYYIMYDKDTINAMTERFLAAGFANNVDTMHNFEIEDGIYLRELYIKDTERGISPKGFEDVEEGSLFATYHIVNDEVWNKVKSGEFKGFSLAGVFQEVEMSKHEEPDETDVEENEILGLIDQLRERMKRG